MSTFTGILAFWFLGVACSWLWQWQKWKGDHHDLEWCHFWKELGPRHVLGNLGLDLLVFGVWDLGLLDGPLDRLGHRFLPVDKLVLIHGGAGKTIWGAFAVGFCSDMFGDQVIYRARRLAARWGRRSTP